MSFCFKNKLGIYNPHQLKNEPDWYMGLESNMRWALKGVIRLKSLVILFSLMKERVFFWGLIKKKVTREQYIEWNQTW